MKNSNAGKKKGERRVSLGIRVHISGLGSMPTWWVGVAAFVTKAISHFHSHL
jgi:hypothetical protein